MIILCCRIPLCKLNGFLEYKAKLVQIKYKTDTKSRSHGTKIDCIHIVKHIQAHFNLYVKFAITTYRDVFGFLVVCCVWYCHSHRVLTQVVVFRAEAEDTVQLVVLAWSSGQEGLSSFSALHKPSVVVQAWHFSTQEAEVKG